MKFEIHGDTRLLLCAGRRGSMSRASSDFTDDAVTSTTNSPLTIVLRGSLPQIFIHTCFPFHVICDLLA